jgi:hypothetical protein
MARCMKMLRAAPLLLLFGLAGCGGDASLAQSAVHAFRAQAAAGRAAEIHAGAAPEMRNAMPLAELREVLGDVQGRLGAFRWARYPRIREARGAQGLLVRLDYDSAYQRGPATETFLFRIAGGKAQLFDYDIRSALLPTDEGSDAD